MARGEAAILWMLLVMELRDQIVAIIMVRNRGYVWQKKDENEEEGVDYGGGGDGSDDNDDYNG